MSAIGIVVIGRNEGERLRDCLEAVTGAGRPAIYVDSGSTDGSPDIAAEAGAEVLRLDPARPFSAARGRNEGFARLRELAPDIDLVQFVDGDCVLDAGWLETAAGHLESNPGTALACGRLRERAPMASTWNRLCDIEFNRPAGEIAACGGIFMIRAGAFADVGGFDESVPAGEEPELCLRLRRRGHRLERLDVPMAEHDAQMTRFGQWWRRAVRSGSAYAQAAIRHGRGPERHGVRESVAIWTWALVLPVVSIASMPITGGLSILLLGLYPVQAIRIARWYAPMAERRGDAALLGTALVVAKFAQLQGQVRMLARTLAGRRADVIEHRRTGTAGPRAHEPRTSET